MENMLFFAGIALIAVIICAPFALRRPTAEGARFVGVFGVLATGTAIALLIGLIEDDWDLKTGLAWIFMPLITAPVSLVVGVFAGAYFAKRVGRRSAKSEL